MSGLFVKLNAEYCTDDEFIEAGPLPELLYIRSLCFCKRKRLDGKISRQQLTTVALGIPNATKHAATLVDVGLWRTTKDGWTIPGWLKWNKSAAEIADDKEARRMASVVANHEQHHVGAGKKKSPKCELCRSDGAPKSEPKSEPDRIRDRLQEEEVEVEVEVEPKGEVEPEEEEEGQFQFSSTSTSDTRRSGAEADRNGPRDEDERDGRVIGTSYLRAIGGGR